jgi:hypothetical protein
LLVLEPVFPKFAEQFDEAKLDDVKFANPFDDNDDVLNIEAVVDAVEIVDINRGEPNVEFAAVELLLDSFKISDLSDDFPNTTTDEASDDLRDLQAPITLLSPIWKADPFASLDSASETEPNASFINVQYLADV